MNVDGNVRTLEQIYQKKTQLEHILLRPDTYIGSVESTSQYLWVLNDNLKMEFRAVNIVPGLYKIFDEILVNAADNKIRDPSMDLIKVDINPSTSKISVYNNGQGVPIEIHAIEKVYIPELIFGHLLTSSNYNDEERKVTGGRNGYGAKLANIFSTEFIVETADGKFSYYQRFSKNMSVMEPPVISPLNLKSLSQDGEYFTRITFTPDLSKFRGLSGSILDQDHLSFFYRRVYDLAGTVKGVSVYLNGKKIPINSFTSYVRLYVESLKLKEQDSNGESQSITPPAFHITINNRWDVAVAPSNGQFQQVSFVNSIHTSKGGTHVNMVTDQIITAISEYLMKKNKGLIVKPHQVKAHLWVFVNSLIENPTFDSQTKETLTLRPAAFGSECQLPTSFLAKITSNSGIVSMLQIELLAAAKAKEDKELKKTDGRKSARLSGIPKLDDANFAGTKQAAKCTLILTEGDSAKALAVSGLSVVGRDFFGVYPLRGKLLNVRDATHKQLSENAEITAIKQILGLQHGKVYHGLESLRYGRIMLMTDQDHDGSHIKGLIINFVDWFWPSLLKMPNGFLTAFITPIVIVTAKNRSNRASIGVNLGPGARYDHANGTISFYTMPEYENWKNRYTPQIIAASFFIKYYKGLGTSTSMDAKRYFSSMDLHAKPFLSIKDSERELIEMVFSKKKADARKEWLQSFVPGTYLDSSLPNFTIEDFVQKELILFSMADNIRSIPNLMDGLKPGLRKILFSCFKRRLKQEIKVAQLAGYVSEHAAYHHGEASLCASIVGMAQNYVGSNNLSLLVPSGQFGTRLQGGKDAASPRYIFTALDGVARMIFMEADDQLLNYLNDDGQSIEPEWYMPIVPMLLINGSEGIGTGWSTFIPPYNPIDIIDNILRRIEFDNSSAMVEMHPWYRSFTGSIIPSSSEMLTYKVYGCASLNLHDSEWWLSVTELPVGTWTQNYKEFLESLVEKAIVKEFTEHHTDTTVSFSIKLGEPLHLLAQSIGESVLDNPSLFNGDCESLFKQLKLVSSLSLSNMVAFDAKSQLKRYSTALEILEDWYQVRLNGYYRRKEYLVAELTRDWRKLDAKMRFINMVLNNELVLAKRPKADIISELISKGFERVSRVGHLDPEENEDDQTGFDYLLGMALWSLTFEKLDQLERERDHKQAELDELAAKTPVQLWTNDLVCLRKYLLNELKNDPYQEQTEKANVISPGKKPRQVIKKEVKQTVKKKETTKMTTKKEVITGKASGVKKTDVVEAKDIVTPLKLKSGGIRTPKRPENEKNGVSQHQTTLLDRIQSMLQKEPDNSEAIPPAVLSSKRISPRAAFRSSTKMTKAQRIISDDEGDEDEIYSNESGFTDESE